MLEDGQGVDHEGVAEEVDELAAVADGVGPAEEEGVVEVAVDGLGVVASPEQVGEVGVAGRDGPEVLGPVELAFGVLVVAVEADGDLAAAEVVGEGVFVVPAVGAGLVGAADGVDAAELVEVVLAVVGEPSDAEGAGSGIEGDGLVVPSGRVMVLASMTVLFSVRRSALSRRGRLGAGLGGGDPVDGEEAEVRGGSVWWCTPRRAVS